MIVKAVREELAAKLSAIPQLRAYAYAPNTVPPPAALVCLPNGIAFDQTYSRGLDHMTLPVLVLVSLSNDRAADAELSPYLDGAGARSIKAALDSSATNTYTSCDDVTVTAAGEPQGSDPGGTPLLIVEFTVEVSGSGS